MYDSTRTFKRWQSLKKPSKLSETATILFYCERLLFKTRVENLENNIRITGILLFSNNLVDATVVYQISSIVFISLVVGFFPDICRVKKIQSSQWDFIPCFGHGKTSRRCYGIFGF